MSEMELTWRSLLFAKCEKEIDMILKTAIRPFQKDVIISVLCRE